MDDCTVKIIILPLSRLAKKSCCWLLATLTTGVLQLYQVAGVAGI
jgi:hypothetical protein